MRIPLANILTKLPLAELEQALKEFLLPLLKRMPAKRLGEVVSLATNGILETEVTTYYYSTLSTMF